MKLNVKLFPTFWIIIITNIIIWKDIFIDCWKCIYCTWIISGDEGLKGRVHVDWTQLNLQKQICSDKRSISIYYLMASTPRHMWGPTWVICVHSLCSITITITKEQLVLITISLLVWWYWLDEKPQRDKNDQTETTQHVKHWQHFKNTF